MIFNQWVFYYYLRIDLYALEEMIDHSIGINAEFCPFASLTIDSNVL